MQLCLCPIADSRCQRVAELHSRDPIVQQKPLFSARAQNHRKACSVYCTAARSETSPKEPAPGEFFEEAPKEIVSKQEAIFAIGLGSWRLRPYIAPAFEALAAQLEGAWRHLPLGALRIEPLPPEFEFCDSIDPERKLDGKSYAEPFPKKGQPGFPRLQVENRCYSTNVFRKLHLELAHRQDNLQVLHCVMYPRQEYDIPILSMDMVGRGNEVSLCIIDPCPVHMDRTIPLFFQHIALELQEKLGLASTRRIPEWGQDIFSEVCILLRPSNPRELSSFLKYAMALHEAYLTSFATATPIEYDRAARLADIRASHQRYAEQQKKNDRTRRVLEAAFSPEFAEKYMQKVMFDTE